MTTAAPTVVFDLDGTLVDTAPDLIATLNVVLAKEGLAPLPYEDARPLIGGGARAMLEKGLLAEGLHPAKQELDRLFEAFVAYYADHIADHSRPFPGLEMSLETLKSAGCRLAVCTNKLQGLSVRLLDALGLSWRFAAICGPDTFGVPKPNPDILRRTILQAGGRPDRAVMVGDSGTDIATARAAGVPIVAVDFGYTDVPVAELSPDRIIGHYDGLVPAIGELLGGLAPAG
jgi:phosphoglycolate phosphatase